MKLKKEHYIIFTIIITEVLGLTLIIPFLPLFAKDLGASPLIIGLILMSFSFFQFFNEFHIWNKVQFILITNIM